MCWILWSSQHALVGSCVGLALEGGVALQDINLQGSPLVVPPAAFEPSLLKLRVQCSDALAATRAQTRGGGALALVVRESHCAAFILTLDAFPLTPEQERGVDRMVRGLTKRGVDGPKVLNLEGCLKEVVGAQAQVLWAALLGQSASVARLNLGFNDLRSGPPLNALCEALATSTTLRELDVGANPLDATAVRAGALCCLVEWDAACR